MNYVAYNTLDINHYMYPDTNLMPVGNLWTCAFTIDPAVASTVAGTSGFRGLFYIPSVVTDATFAALGTNYIKLPNNRLQLVYYQDPNVNASRRYIPEPTTFEYYRKEVL
ncbi:hypothetical protein H072_10373 [Dactylellina haptotyla CBS 200.50]|uniref:Uncharacterized protein n=1 Tax=Dactylellina haptotyla (strain CBS 200.50) TaxID=1284197 RepID=S8A4Y1_DACHA|nr:hypothetical protein H072_10373 [Dactylellina haptotyla CBS 200.50]